MEVAGVAEDDRVAVDGGEAKEPGLVALGGGRFDGGWLVAGGREDDRGKEDEDEEQMAYEGVSCVGRRYRVLLGEKASWRAAAANEKNRADGLDGGLTDAMIRRSSAGRIGVKRVRASSRCGAAGTGERPS